jgi:hypothetical protein
MSDARDMLADLVLSLMPLHEAIERFEEGGKARGIEIKKLYERLVEIQDAGLDDDDDDDDDDL